MSVQSADTIREAVSAAYGARAREVAAGTAVSCCDPTCCNDGEAGAGGLNPPDSTSATGSRAAGVRSAYYAPNDTETLPESVVSYGCGNPIAIAGLRAGESVLDLGSGAGLDCFLAAQQVGAQGHVIGLDMTDDMLTLAKQNKAKLGVTNVEFKKGTIEAIPLPDASVNVIISNCVINLSPDKDAVFREAFRVLTPGGRVHVSDVVLLHELSAAEQADLDLWAGCISGALQRDDYIARLRAAGFTDVEVQIAPTGEEAAAKPYRSALINARRPGGTEAGRAWAKPGLEVIELLAPAGLATAACCATDDGVCEI